MKLYCLINVTILMFMISAVISEPLRTIPYSPASMEKIVFFFNESFNIDLISTEGHILLHLRFYSSQILTDSSDTNGWCGSLSHYYKHNSWQPGRNVGSVWYEHELFYFKLNNMNSNYTRPCTEFESTSTIKDIEFHMDTIENVRIMMSCVRK